MDPHTAPIPLSLRSKVLSLSPCSLFPRSWVVAQKELGDYTLTRTSSCFCSFVLRRWLRLSLPAMWFPSGRFWTRAPKASRYLCVESPCRWRQLAWPLGIVWGLNPGAGRTASAPGPLFPSLLSSLLTLLPPVSGASQPSRALECYSRGKERSRTKWKGKFRDRP